MSNIDEPVPSIQGEGEHEDDERMAESDFEDMIIEVDESEVEAELNAPSTDST